MHLTKPSLFSLLLPASSHSVHKRDPLAPAPPHPGEGPVLWTCSNFFQPGPHCTGTSLMDMFNPMDMFKLVSQFLTSRNKQKLKSTHLQLCQTVKLEDILN